MKYLCSNKQVKVIRSRSLGQPKAVLRTFLVAPYLSRYTNIGVYNCG